MKKLRNLVIEALDKPWKTVDDYAIGRKGEKIRIGDNVIAGKPGTCMYGIGVVKNIGTEGKVVTVRLYPWLSPGFDGETYVLPADWVTIDEAYERRLERYRKRGEQQ